MAKPKMNKKMPPKMAMPKMKMKASRVMGSKGNQMKGC